MYSCAALAIITNDLFLVCFMKPEEVTSSGRQPWFATVSRRSQTSNMLGSGDNINGQDRMKNGEGVARGMIQENERRSDSVEEIDGIELGSRKRNRREGVSPL